MINVVLQHFEGCPNGPELLRRVRQALAMVPGGTVSFRQEHIDTLEAARRRRFRGSPTLLINGEDWEGAPEPDEPRLACRVYPGGLPTPEAIAARIRSVTRAGEG